MKYLYLIIIITGLVQGCNLTTSLEQVENYVPIDDVLYSSAHKRYISPPESCKSFSEYVNIKSKDDVAFKYFNCLVDDKFYILEYLVTDRQQIFLNRHDNGYGLEFSKIEAYDIYQPDNIEKPPLLIVIHSQSTCCYPRPSGTSYTVNLFQISNYNDLLTVKDYTDFLANGVYENNMGFDGSLNDTEEKSTFKFKDIDSVTNWLDENY